MSEPPFLKTPRTGLKHTKWVWAKVNILDSRLVFTSEKLPIIPRFEVCLGRVPAISVWWRWRGSGCLTALSDLIRRHSAPFFTSPHYDLNKSRNYGYIHLQMFRSLLRSIRLHQSRRCCPACTEIISAVSAITSSASSVSGRPHQDACDNFMERHSCKW